MQGFVFCELQEFAQIRFGFEVWDQIAESIETDIRNYNLFNSYPEEEFETLIARLSEKVNVPYQEILRQFGELIPK